MLSDIKIKTLIKSTVLSACLFSSFAWSQDVLNNTTHRYIIKFKKTAASLGTSELSSNLLSSLKPIMPFIKNNGSDLKLNKITNNTYELNIVSDKSIISSNISAALKNNPNLVYITKDRIGYFKPLPDPKPDLNLIKQMSKITPNIFELNHSLQWDEFNAPAGVFLESKPDLADGAWRYSVGATATNTPITVAVLDTGIEYNDNLTNNITQDSDKNYFGWNFSNNDNNLSDETGGYHGTHVAGTIAAHGPSMLGMGTSIKILPVKIPDDTGMFYESNVIKGIYWAVGEKVENVPSNLYPAKVLNMSFGIDEYVGKEVDECSPAVQEAINFARDKGVTIVVAAGNSNMDNDLGSPGGCHGAIRVASTGPTGLRSYFSNYGHDVNFAAPGGDKKFGQTGGILSTVKNESGLNSSGLDFYQGTSMASPHVAGLAALLYSVNDILRNYSNKDIETIMSATTHDFGVGFNDEYSCKGLKTCGHGIINANNAVQAAIANYDVIMMSPDKEFLDLQASDSCRPGLYNPKNKSIIKSEGQWTIEQDSNRCQYMTEYSHPHLTIDSVHKVITAHYASVKYNLAYNYSSCFKIGYDGIGCYK